RIAALRSCLSRPTAQTSLAPRARSAVAYAGMEIFFQDPPSNRLAHGLRPESTAAKPVTWISRGPATTAWIPFRLAPRSVTCQWTPSQCQARPWEVPCARSPKPKIHTLTGDRALTWVKPDETAQAGTG